SRQRCDRTWYATSAVCHRGRRALTRAGSMGHDASSVERNPSPHPRRPRELATADHRLPRREFIRSTGILAAATLAPFSFVRPASARTDRLHRYLLQKLDACNTPSLAVAVVRGEDIVFADAVGWADREHGLRASPQTPYMLASISKTITCAGIMA